MAYDVIRDDGYLISDEADRLDLAVIHRFLSTDSYWAAGRAFATTTRAIANSLCMGLYAPDGALAGFARAATDRTLMAHLADVFVLPAHRGAGRGRALVAAMLAHPELATVRRWTLSTSDAHGLYAGFGFGPILSPERQMMRMVDPVPAPGP